MSVHANSPDCLIVDDDEGICELVRDALIQEHITCDFAHTGAEALEKLNRKRPVLTLLDLGLPDMDGRRIARSLGERVPRIPFIVITGLSDTQLAIELMKQGAVDFLIKDINFLNLIADAVKRALTEIRRNQKLLDAESALRESEERFRQMAANIRDAFFVTSAPDGAMLYMSPAYEKIWGRPIAALHEHPLDWMSSVVEEDREHVLQQRSAINKNNRMVKSTFRIRKSDGSIRWIESQSFPVLDENGRIYRIAGLASDITDRVHLEQEILNISEQERRRIGHDLHDDLCQRLAAIKLKCELLAKQTLHGTSREHELAEDISKKIAEATALSRSLARGLSPIDLEADGLMAALPKLTNTVEALHEIPCFFYCPDMVRIENTTTAMHIYRIAQELLNNAARHAVPSRIDVRLEADAVRVRLEVENDGSSFVESSEPGPGMGLKIIRYRANAIGATVNFHPRHHKLPGTVASCLIPQSVCNPAEPTTP